MITTCFGWTFEQIAHAKKRYGYYNNEELPPNATGILKLRQWWTIRGWPDPLSVLFEGVVLEFDKGWAATAIREVMLIAPKTTYCTGDRGEKLTRRNLAPDFCWNGIEGWENLGG